MTRGIGHIHAHLDHGGGNQRADPSLAEPAHDLFLLVGPELAMDQADLVGGTGACAILRRPRWRIPP